MNLTRKELRIWEAAYAAAFVREMYDAVDYFDANPQEGRAAIDSAIALVSGERPMHVADEAVNQWRERRNWR